MKIGLIGIGTLGESVLQRMIRVFDVVFYDKHIVRWPFCRLSRPYREYRVCELTELLKVADGPIFLCLPPSNYIVEEVCKDINDLVRDIYYDQKIPRGTAGRIVVIKSKVTPPITNVLNARYEYLQCVYNPETQGKIVLGGPDKAVSFVKRIYQKACPDMPTIKTDAGTAEMVKYVADNFLERKELFAFEMWETCNRVGVDYDKVVECVIDDTRLGTTHWGIKGEI
jgi:3-hydroxyisobutyrate dehydrogenase-like beta-hydroxyacid dehydrogenase